MQRLLAQGNEDDVQFEMIRMQTANGEDGGLCAGEEEPQPTSWLSSLKHFFYRQMEWNRILDVNESRRWTLSRQKKNSMAAT